MQHRIFEYISRQPKQWVRNLYTDYYVCMAVYRSLPELAKQFVLRFLFLEPGDSVDTQTIQSWIATDGHAVLYKAIEYMVHLHIMNETKTLSNIVYSLEESFGHNLRKIISCEGAEEQPQVLDVEKGVVTVEQIEEESRSKWEGILQIIVNPVSCPRDGCLIQILQPLNLIR
eukprot:TRINITY_DN5664_c0_g1_i1.p2 TRINITY_DN5664_c0_g1~~TRINITY_DN5664_c0_g1_i1.p2  ORF type:complete len:172 (-),score=39.89 TRINITY_DN5664_c0_g1_i1:1066-1581(-)